MFKKNKKGSGTFMISEQPLAERDGGYDGKPCVEVNEGDVSGRIVSGSDVNLPFKRMPRGELYRTNVVAMVRGEDGGERYFDVRAMAKKRGMSLSLGRKHN